MIGIIDYGMGNLRSVENALAKLQKPCLISADPSVLAGCEKLILPGVGAFRDCMRNIEERGLKEPVCELAVSGKPLLGICLGMQMLFEESEENGITAGFGFLKGSVTLMKTDLPIPQIGWNLLEFTRSHPLQEKLSAAPYVYYVHSYRASGYDDSDLLGYSMYGDLKVPGLVVKNNIMGCQFHPEKSGEDGLKILNYFAEEFV